LQAIVLAGGFGTRLKGVLSDLPKPMAPINKKPFLNFLLNFARSHGVERLILCTGYLHEKIESYYGSSFEGVSIEYSVEKEPLGTGGAIKKALSMVADREVFVMNGDTFFEVDLTAMMNAHRNTNPPLSMALKKVQDADRYGSVVIDGQKIVGFEEKNPGASGLINGGIYVVRKDLFEPFNLPEIFSLEKDFLKVNVAGLGALAFVSTSFFIDIGLPEDLSRAQTEMSRYE